MQWFHVQLLKNRALSKTQSIWVVWEKKKWTELVLALS